MLDQIPVIEMPMAQAAKELRNYQEFLQDRATKTDRIAKRAYKELAKGRRIINIEDAFRLTGVDEKGRPRLAVARADWSEVFFAHRFWYGSHRLIFSGEAGDVKQAFKMPFSILPGLMTRGLKARVPVIPPQFRPADELDKYHILFEAAWEEVPPVDPFLLKVLKYPFFVILAKWDLTPVERMIFQLMTR